MCIILYRKKEVDVVIMEIVKEMIEVGLDVDESENEKKEEVQSNGVKELLDDNLVSQVYVVFLVLSLCKILF